MHKTGKGTLGRVCGDIGTRVWGLRKARRWMWRRMGCGASNIRDPRGKVGRKCDIASFVKMCYLWSPLDSIVQIHIGHVMMFTESISLYRGKCTAYLD